MVAALTISGVALSALFESHVRRRVDQELGNHLKQLAARVELSAAGAPTLTVPLSDPRFDQPLSGLYWQVETETGARLASRSLWRQALPLPPFAAPADQGPEAEFPAFDAAAPAPPPSPGAEAAPSFEAPGAEGETLILRARTVFLETPAGDVAARLAAAIDKAEITRARDAFALEMSLALALLAAALLAASVLQIFVGLRPLTQLARAVNAVRTGAAFRIEGAHPREVHPLVEEMNALLGTNAQMLARARDAAADLAHGLKTPLAVLAAESRRLAENGQTESAAEIDAQIEAMRQRVERHLAAVRLRGAGAGPPGRTEARAALEKLLKAMAAAPRGESLVWRIEGPERLRLAIDPQDFYEVMGNLLDNARKWARSAVTTRLRAVRGGWAEIVIEDDGPGLPPEKIGEAMARGGRLDERKTGAGLGLAIAERALAAYGGALRLENAPAGGARAVIRLPVLST